MMKPEPRDWRSWGRPGAWPPGGAGKRSPKKWRKISGSSWPPKPWKGSLRPGTVRLVEMLTTPGAASSTSSVKSGSSQAATDCQASRVAASSTHRVRGRIMRIMKTPAVLGDKGEPGSACDGSNTGVQRGLGGPLHKGSGPFGPLQGLGHAQQHPGGQLPHHHQLAGLSPQVAVTHGGIGDAQAMKARRQQLHLLHGRQEDAQGGEAVARSEERRVGKGCS